MDCNKVYKKRDGTSGIRGQLYETKLISLLLFRARHNSDIEEFHLATNVDLIGTFDDICFRAKVKGFDRPVAVFIQAKHRENDKVLTLNSKNDLSKYFDSYLKIRRAFKSSKKDVLFDGKFDETECLFVMYTTAKGDNNNKLPKSIFASNLNDLIGSGGVGLQPCYTNEDVKFLCEMTLKEQITSLAVNMSKYLCNEADFQMMMNDELVLQYHVILSKKVLHVSDLQLEGHRLVTFRESFFNTNDEFNTIFRDTLFFELLNKQRVSESEIRSYLTIYFQQNPSPEILSMLIGSIITYNKNGKLEFINKRTAEDLKQQLNKVYVSQITVNKAIQLAAKNILKTGHFKVPAAFGNTDLIIRGNEAKVEKRLNHLTTKIYDLISESTPNTVVTIDESLGIGFLQLNGGIASAVGNIFVLDDDTKLMKFTENYDILGDLSKKLLNKLKIVIHDLQKYRFEVKVKKFPKLSVDCSEYDEILAKDFLNKLIFYTNQADEKGVEDILKNEIEDHQYSNGMNLRVRSDAVFLKYHDEIQKWWMLPQKGSYLTKEIEAYDSIIRKIVKDPLMSVIHIIYRNKIKNIDYTFKEDAVRSLKLQEEFSSTNIVSENSTLTVAKAIQHFKNKDHVLLDLDFILNLPMNEYNALCTELMNTSHNTILIFVWDNVRNSRNQPKTLERIAKAVHNKTSIIISNQNLAVIIRKYFSNAVNIVNDQRNNLIDMSHESQKNILENAKVIFQGEVVSLDSIVDDVSMAFVEGDVLNKIISKENIVIGQSLGNSNYDEIKHLYVDRRVSRSGKPERGRYYDMMRRLYLDPSSMGYYDNVVETLNDITDDVVLITAKPGMGKSTLLTHLSLKTKELNPKVWIVRLNLLNYAKEFSKWQENKTVIDTLETLNFLCLVILSEKHGKIENLTIKLEESNSVVNLKNCTGDDQTVFELKMFLHFYNNEDMIFLFDGFDEICPHYSSEVIQLLKTVRNYPRKLRMWVASRSYNKIKSILQREFGSSYKIEHFSYDDQEKYLEKFWKSNLSLKELNSAQLDNVNEFMVYIIKNLKTFRYDFGSLSKLQYLPLREIYFKAFDYLRNEINNSYIPLWTNKTNFNHTKYDDMLIRLQVRHQYNGKDSDISNMYKFVATPLHLYLIADYFQNEIKDLRKVNNKWNLDISTFTIYERFLETKLKRIRFQEKNKMDIYNPDIMITYDKEYADFIVKHKKLAAYAIFHRENHELFSRKELKDIKNTMKLIKKGGEKTGLINNIASNNIPIFIHRTFAEYFAVEHICDLMKNEKCSNKQKCMLHFIFNVMFFSSPANVLNILDSKIVMDNALMNFLKKNDIVIFDLLMEQAKRCSDNDSHFGGTSDENEYKSSLNRAVAENLRNFVNLFMTIFESFLHVDNVNDFIHLINKTSLVTTAIVVKCEEIINFALNIVRKLDFPKISLLFDSVISYFNPSRNYDEWSNEEIIEELRSSLWHNLTITYNVVDESHVSREYQINI